MSPCISLPTKRHTRFGHGHSHCCRFLGGAFIGSIIQAPISLKFGRRTCNASAAALLVIAGALLAGSVHIAMFITARVCTGIGAGILTSNNPVYVSEISPPSTRGLLTSVHGVGITFAYVFSSLLAFGFNYVDHPYQWRLQFVVYTFCSLILLISIYFIPESPRWLTASAYGYTPVSVPGSVQLTIDSEIGKRAI